MTNKSPLPSTSRDTRALAAQVLAAVVFDGRSLREALAPVQAQLADSRDRALLTAIANEGARGWLRFDAALDLLLDKPLRKREPLVHALLVAGLAQLESLRLPPHAAVAATVEAARALHRAPFANLVNAVLRRWLRERETLNAQLDRDPSARTAHPAWLVGTIARDWPDQSEAILAANNAPVPPMLRVNRRVATREAMIAALQAHGSVAGAHPFLADALVLDEHADIARLPEFREGKLSVQDGAAQLAADLLDVRDGMRVLDACAAPGGKACHLLERANLELFALDREPQRVVRIRENLARLHLHCEVRVGDAGEPAKWWDGKPFDRILLDAPCSATGVIRRHPDIKLHRRAQDIAALSQQQRTLLETLWPLLQVDGKLVYATCSFLRAENEEVVAEFLRAHPSAEALPFVLPAGHKAGPGWQVLPDEGGLDGMYYAVLRKLG
ncbi:MAG TPA: 16S rRNA (cytosine(967)-C(5))-methyltransferase RsmB [Rhodanobacteraceae bacterium]|nr:16S rRNA (cytosine(967)-C(5))-methyltransferase RsmB [Rhodanobacteraceae bacterium]